MVGPESSVTAMSGRRPRETWNFARLPRVARASLLLALMGMGGQGCVITGSTEIDPPKQTPPYFSKLSPPIYQVQKLTSLGTSPSSLTEIQFEVVSEDLGQPIFGAVYRDFHGFGDMRPLAVISGIKPAKIPAGHMTDAVPRPGSAQFEITGAPGCHSATLVLSHEFNGPGDPRPTQDKDSAYATWWYFLDDDPMGPAVDIATCVTPASASTDAGSADASDGGL